MIMRLMKTERGEEGRGGMFIQAWFTFLLLFFLFSQEVLFRRLSSLRHLSVCGAALLSVPHLGFN